MLSDKSSYQNVKVIIEEYIKKTTEKIYLDYHRNTHILTCICVLSLTLEK